MKLASKLLVSLGKRSGHVIMRHELSRLASPSHLSAGLAQLMDEGRLVRLGEGLYAKARPDQNGRAQLLVEVVDLAREVFAKLGIQIQAVKQEVDCGRPVLWVDVGNRRVGRKLEIAGTVVRYVRHSADNKALVALPTNPDALPTIHVQRFVERFAKAHGINYVRTGLDDYAEAVTRAAGDEVKLDSVGKLLVVLKKNNLIDGSQLARLMTNHMREVKSVRSVRRLRERGVPAQH